MTDRLDVAIAAFREVEPHAIINRAALFAVINAERERCTKFVEEAANDYLRRADRLAEAGANIETVRLHEQAGAALEVAALNLKTSTS